MPDVVSVTEFVDGWYPGYTPAMIDAPYVVDAFGPFTERDQDSFWFLDFHWPRGLTPLGAYLWAADGYCWGTQHAAENLPLPPGRGVTARFAGTHLYGSPLTQSDPYELVSRGERLARGLPRFLRSYPKVWEDGRAELEARWAALLEVDLTRLPDADLAGHLHRARRYLRRAMEIHFEVMYPLLVNYLAFRSTCTELGIDPGEVGKFLQGEDTRIMETDRALAGLATTARGAGLSGVFAGSGPSDLRQELATHGGAAAHWLTTFDDFLHEHGHRVEGATDIALPSWIEDPTPPLEMIKSFLRAPAEHDFAAAARSSVVDRDAAIDAARSGLTRSEQELFDQGLAVNQVANFPWWQDDHNVHIDLKVMLPMRWACFELARRVGADRPDDMLFLFWPELVGVAEGHLDHDTLRAVVEDRRQYFDHWHGRRATMPKVLGTVPDTITDPLLIEIFGLDARSLSAVRDPAAADATRLAGVAAAPGVARGVARVLLTAGDLPRLEPGSILVCESTSPNWTPAFGKIAGAVCDGGGVLSHAAIVGREYGVPTVTAVGTATLAIRDGDVVEVDGTSGIVTIIERASGTADRLRVAASAPRDGAR